MNSLVTAALLFFTVVFSSAQACEKAAELVAQYGAANTEGGPHQDLAYDLNGQYDFHLRNSPGADRKVKLIIGDEYIGDVLLFVQSYLSTPDFLKLLEPEVRDAVLAATISQIARGMKEHEKDMPKLDTLGRSPRRSEAEAAKWLSAAVQFTRPSILPYLEENGVWARCTDKGRVLLGTILVEHGKLAYLKSLLPERRPKKPLPYFRLWSDAGAQNWASLKHEVLDFDDQIRLSSLAQANLRIAHFDKSLGLALTVRELDAPEGQRLTGPTIKDAIERWDKDKSLPRSWTFAGPYRLRYFEFFRDVVFSTDARDRMPKPMRWELYRRTLDGLAQRENGFHRPEYLAFQALFYLSMGKTRKNDNFIAKLSPREKNMLLALSLRFKDEIKEKKYGDLVTEFLKTGQWTYSSLHALPDDIGARVAAELFKIDAHAGESFQRDLSYDTLGAFFTNEHFWSALSVEDRQELWRDHLQRATRLFQSRAGTYTLDELLRAERENLLAHFTREEIRALLYQYTRDDKFMRKLGFAEATLLGNLALFMPDVK